MGTSRESKTGAKVAGRTTTKKTAKKATASAKAKAADAPSKKRAASPSLAETKTAATARRRATATAAKPRRSARPAADAEAAPAPTTRKRAAAAAKESAPAVVPSAPPPPPPPAPSPARDPREERRARLEEKLAMRSAALREQQQRAVAAAPAPVAPARAPSPGSQERDRTSRPAAPAMPGLAAPPGAGRPDLPFDPTAFRGPAHARPGTAEAGSSDAALDGAAGGRKRRRRRRRRRGAGGEGEVEGMPPIARPGAPPQAAVASSPAPEQVDREPGSDDAFEGGGRRRRRRRRRRRGGEGEPEQPIAAQAPPQRPSQAPRGGSAWDEPEDEGRGGGRRGRRRRRGGDRGPTGPLPWDSEREAPAVNILPERDPFSELVSIDPEERIDLETDTDEISMRVVDIVTPIGKGQRALIVAPPKTGKTTLLMQLARAISENHPEVELIVMLVDERPEEVTAFRRAGYGEIMASSNDEPTQRHLRLTQHVLEVAKRRVLEGKDVCILLDSITRMARAHNVASSGHKTLSGGLDSRALERPKRFFGAARKIADGGSLTILATALIDTGSRMDEVIFQEFKGTGNSELVLDRRLAERRIWPAIDIQKSGTRKEEKLFERDEYEGIIALRRALSGKPPAEAMQMLLSHLGRYRSNREFLLDVARKAATAF